MTRFNELILMKIGYTMENEMSIGTDKNMQNKLINHMLYSDKLRLSVLDLTRIDLATGEDKAYHSITGLPFLSPPPGRRLRCLLKRMIPLKRLPIPFTS